MQVGGSGALGPPPPINVRPQGGQQAGEIHPEDISVHVMIIREAQESVLCFLLNMRPL